MVDYFSMSKDDLETERTAILQRRAARDPNKVIKVNGPEDEGLKLAVIGLARMRFSMR